jgi:hypothetical protein
MATFVFFCLFWGLMEVQRRESAARQKRMSMARYRPPRKCDDPG